MARTATTRKLSSSASAGIWPWLGLALSSAAFALLHEPPGLSASHGWSMLLLWAVYGFMSLCFGWVYYRSGSLWAAYAAHAINNLIAVAAVLASS